MYRNSGRLVSLASPIKDDAVKTYSMDLRVRVLKDVDAGLTTSAVAAKYSVSTAWVRRLKQRRAVSGLIGPKPQRRGSIPAAVTYAEQIREAVRQAPDATLDEYRTRLKWPMSRSTLANALIALGLTRKKSRSRRASRIVPMSRHVATSGRPHSLTSIRNDSCSSTRPGPAPT